MTSVAACRDPNRTEPAVKDIQNSTKNPNVEFIHLDLANLASVRNFVEEVKKRGLVVDLLINNAGVMVSIINFHRSLLMLLNSIIFSLLVCLISSHPTQRQLTVLSFSLV